MLELKNITKVVGADTHIHPTNLVLERGSLNVLLGPTLSGKTSLMRLMAGLDKPTTGTIMFDGKDVTGVRVQDRSIAMVYQQFINYPAMTVYENIASPMRISGKDAATIDREVRKAAELMKLTPYLERTPLNLSGGQQQRTALARAIVKNASLVLLDEPLANLDYKLREELREELPKLFAAAGSIFVYATTEPQEALLLGGNTATLSEGRISQFGPTISVYRKPADIATAKPLPIHRSMFSRWSSPAVRSNVVASPCCRCRRISPVSPMALTPSPFTRTICRSRARMMRQQR